MLGQVLDKLDAWVGRSFLIASFFPFLIFLAANAVTAQLITPDIAQYVVSYFAGGIYGPISATVTCLAAAAAVAYVTDPVVGLMSRFLEGAYFPRPISDWLATDQTKRIRDLEDATQLAGRTAARLEDYKKQLPAQLRAANDIGVSIGAILKPELIQAAQSRIAPLERKQSRQQPIDLGELKTAAAALQDALKENCADSEQLAPGSNEQDERNSENLYRLFNSLLGLAEYAHLKIVNEYSRNVHEKQMNFAAMELPTEFGNHAAALRAFFENRFQFDFDFFWPIVQLVLQGDQSTMDRLNNNRQKLDFCVRILLYTIVFTATWLAIATFVGRELAVGLIGTAGFLISILWLQIIHSNYRALSELVRSIVIVKRFDVMKALHQRLPANWAEEKQMWKKVTTQLLWGSDAVIDYQHPDK